MHELEDPPKPPLALDGRPRYAVGQPVDVAGTPTQQLAFTPAAGGKMQAFDSPPTTATAEKSVLSASPSPTVVGQPGFAQQRLVGERTDPDFYNPGGGAMAPPPDRAIRGESKNWGIAVRAFMVCGVLALLLALLFGIIFGWTSGEFRISIMLAVIWIALVVVMVFAFGA